MLNLVNNNYAKHVMYKCASLAVDIGKVPHVPSEKGGLRENVASV